MLYLASQSLRRQELLRQLDFRFELLTVDVPEQPGPGEAAREYVCRVARDKAVAGLAALGSSPSPSDLVIGADTEVVLDGEVFGKPADAAAAQAMLRRLSGREHVVLSAVWLVGGDRQDSALSTSIVRFAPLSPADIDGYVATGEWSGKAGAYAIQGRAAALIAHLSGSYSGVMGLPLFETAQLLQARSAGADFNSSD